VRVDVRSGGLLIQRKWSTGTTPVSVLHGTDSVFTTSQASKAPKRHRTCIKACIAYYQYVDYYHDEYGTLDITSSSSFINERTFDKFLVTGYDPMKKIVRYTSEFSRRVTEQEASRRLHVPKSPGKTTPKTSPSTPSPGHINKTKTIEWVDNSDALDIHERVEIVDRGVNDGFDEQDKSKSGESSLGTEEGHVEVVASPENIRFIPTIDLIGQAFIIDEEWDPKVSDNSISIEPNRYSSTNPQAKYFITNQFDENDPTSFIRLLHATYNFKFRRKLILYLSCI
jgi:hypothetical protein